MLYRKVYDLLDAIRPSASRRVMIRVLFVFLFVLRRGAQYQTPHTLVDSYARTYIILLTIATGIYTPSLSSFSSSASRSENRQRLPAKAHRSEHDYLWTAVERRFQGCVTMHMTKTVGI
jgi:hypothetical protein